MKKLLTLVAATTVLALAGAANATVFVGDYSATVNTTSPGLELHTTDLPGSINLNLLTVGSSQYVELFTLWTDEGTVNWGEDTVPKPISVNFTFTSPTGFGGTVTGTTTGQLSGILGYYQDGYVSWIGAVEMAFGNGGVLRVLLNDTHFNKGEWWGLNEGEKYGATIGADFKLISNGVPEPATWAMMITGFGLVGATLRRRRALGVAA